MVEPPKLLKYLSVRRIIGYHFFVSVLGTDMLRGDG